MRLKNYLNEMSIKPTKVEVRGNKLVVSGGSRGKNEYLEIPEKPKVIMLKNQIKSPTKTTMIYKDGNIIWSYDNRNNKESFKSLDKLANYLNDNNFVYFEGYNLFTMI